LDSINHGLQKALQLTALQRKKIARQAKARTKQFTFEKSADKIIQYLKTWQG
jgi:hypothetical protein